MAKKKSEPISLKFIIFLLVSFLAIVFYISSPNEIKKPKKDKTFEEMLEYTNIKQDNNREISAKIENQNKYNTEEEIDIPVQHSTVNAAETNIQIKNTDQDYYKLLDKLSEYPAKNLGTVNNIVNELLRFKGYPQNTVRVVSTDIDQSKAKTHGNYMVANFDFNTGNLLISSKMLYELDTKMLIAVLAHELDHFDKLAKVCKSMGINEFNKLFNDNNIKNIDTTFWANASSHANIKDFESETYKNALKRFITQNNLELSSSYSDFYRLSENMRNPLEISAYAESDKVYNHFNIPITEGPIKILTKKFNEVDWSIYNSISNNSLIKDERIAIFDYFFMKAILTKYPDYKHQFDICINQKNGDLTSFWLAFENNASSFYQKGKMDNETYQKMLSLLSQTDAEIKKGINNTEIANALKYKINTLNSNLVYPNAEKNLQKTIMNYLEFIQKENIVDEEEELKSILILICMENELYTNNRDKQISLYYIKMPEFLNRLYDIQHKKQKYLFIYNNKAFKSKLTEGKTEQALLTELINKNRLDLRIKD